MQTVSVVSCLLWFLIVGVVEHHVTSAAASSSAAMSASADDGDSTAATIFWCFMIFVLFVPASAALVMLGVVLHLVNYVSRAEGSFRAISITAPPCLLFTLSVPDIQSSL